MHFIVLDKSKSQERKFPHALTDIPTPALTKLATHLHISSVGHALLPETGIVDVGDAAHASLGIRIGRGLEKLLRQDIVRFLDREGAVEGGDVDLAVAALDGHLVDDGQGGLVAPGGEQRHSHGTAAGSEAPAVALHQERVHGLGRDTADDLSLLVVAVLPLDHGEGDAGAQRERLHRGCSTHRDEVDDH